MDFNKDLPLCPVGEVGRSQRKSSLTSSAGPTFQEPLMMSKRAMIFLPVGKECGCFTEETVKLEYEHNVAFSPL